MRQQHKILPLFMLLTFLSCLSSFGQATSKPHIFLIYLDDLNDYGYDLNGHPQAIMPGLNTISELGTVFYNAHAPSPKCAPSRTSMITGKDVNYTQVYNNPACKPLNEYFTSALNNETYFTLPGYFKDNGYFTYGINKIYHCFDSESDYDSLTLDACNKSMSWNKFSLFTGSDDSAIINYGNTHNYGLKEMRNSLIPDSMEYLQFDYRAVDSALLFLDDVAAGTASTCDRPVFIMMGLRKPHSPWYIPEKYYSADYIADYYTEPYNFPFNSPNNAYPYNGAILPPQPDSLYADFFALGQLGKYFAEYDSAYYNLNDKLATYDPLPDFSGVYTAAEKLDILTKSIKANNVISYLAASRFVDAQVKRFMDSLATYPEIYNNSIIVFVSDNGFSLGEKRHWLKGTLWDSDMRVPFVIADLRNPIQQTVLNAVSLLDLFPTLCEMTNIAKPTFPDGSAFLDGHSLTPFLADANTHIEQPALGTYKEQKPAQCSCFPQFSVRNDYFHFIQYTSNNEDTLLTCNSTLAWKEQELYEIGRNFEKDPNEWNNLINNPAYYPVVNYFQQWLLDSALYLTKTFYLNIDNHTTSCYLEQSDLLDLSFTLYDTAGVLITPPSNFVYRWTNNANGDTLFGAETSFDMTTVSDDYFLNNAEIMFIVEMVDTSKNNIAGLAVAYFKINPANEPYANFELLDIGGMTVAITDFEITGQYDSYFWNFGYGNLFYNTVPGPITFPAPGDFNIDLTIKYGNDATCEKSISKSIVAANDLPATNGNLLIFPNPGSENLSVITPKQITNTTIRMYSINGKEVFQQRFLSANYNFSIPAENLQTGTYLITISGDNYNANCLYVHF